MEVECHDRERSLIISAVMLHRFTTMTPVRFNGESMKKIPLSVLNCNHGGGVWGLVGGGLVRRSLEGPLATWKLALKSTHPATQLSLAYHMTCREMPETPPSPTCQDAANPERGFTIQLPLLKTPLHRYSVLIDHRVAARLAEVLIVEGWSLTRSCFSRLRTSTCSISVSA
jgi:hypothetical protein